MGFFEKLGVIIIVFLLSLFIIAALVIWFIGWVIISAVRALWRLV